MGLENLNVKLSLLKKRVCQCRKRFAQRKKVILQIANKEILQIAKVVMRIRTVFPFYHGGAPVKLNDMQIASLRGHSICAACTPAHTRDLV